ncbi:hypothetical protein C0J52_20826 [Blattella germanica]|nr:hypothetical protein C0J52_20826 [Blattella germanica]
MDFSLLNCRKFCAEINFLLIKVRPFIKPQVVANTKQSGVKRPRSISSNSSTNPIPKTLGPISSSRNLSNDTFSEESSDDLETNSKQDR